MRPPIRDPVPATGGYAYRDNPNVDQTGWVWWNSSVGEGYCPPDEVPRGAAVRVPGGGGSKASRKRKVIKNTGSRGKASRKHKAPGDTDGDDDDGASPVEVNDAATAAPMDVAGGGGGDDGGDGGVTPMDVVGDGGGEDGGDGGVAPVDMGDDDVSVASFGGGGGDDSDNEWSAGGNDRDNDGGSSSGSGGDDTDGEGSDSDGRGRGGGGRGRGGGGRAPKRLNGTSRLSGPYLMELFTTPSSDPKYEKSDKEHIAANRKQADDKFKKREGTAPVAKCTKYGIGSMPRLEIVLRGLTEDSRGLPIKNGVFFDRKQLKDLKDDFNIAYTLDPKHIGVTICKTKVKKGGRELVVKSFNHGEYTMEDDKTKMKQWELLEFICGGSVKLEDALRRFIIHLVTTQTIMKIHSAPFVRKAKYPEMLWNIDDAIERFEEEGTDVELEDGEMDLPELKELKVRRKGCDRY